MAKQSAPIQEVSRLLDLVPYLSTHSHISLKELSREFGVDEKAMANELTALSMCGLPGYTPYELIEIFFESGFVTINNHDALDIPRALTSLEVASLLIGLELLKDGTTHEDGQVIAKIDDLLVQMRALIGSSIEVKASPVSTHLSLINSSIADRSVLELEYLSPVQDEITTRTVDPLSIKVEGNFTYLVAFSHQQRSVRNFRLDRVKSLKKTGLPSSTTEVMSNISETALEISLKVAGSRRAVAELFQLAAIPPSGEVTAHVFSPEWAAKAVIAHSPELVLNEPSQLRIAIRAELENILALYAP